MVNKRCGAKTKQKIGTCQQYGLKGGNGRCKLHNGKAKIKHGRYSSKAKRERTKEREFLEGVRLFFAELNKP